MIHRCVCALPRDVIVRLPFGGTGRPDWSGRKENTFINRDIPSKPVFPVRMAVKGPLAKPGKKIHFFFHKITGPVSQFWIFVRDLKIAVFRHFPRTSRSHVTKTLLWDLPFNVHVCTARTRPRGKWFTARFSCNLKHDNPTFEKKYDFLELFCLLIIQFCFKKT